ncbi:MAG: acetolactate synthase small subunit [Candidatus Dormibacteria bacterium]
MSPAGAASAASSARLISLRVEERGQALLRVANCLARRGFRLESCALGPSPEEGVLALTLRVDPRGQAPEQISRQLAKLIDLVRVEDLTGAPAVEWSSALVELEMPGAETEGLLARHGARVLHRDQGRLVAAISGRPEEVEAAISELRALGPVDYVQGGPLALVPGRPRRPAEVKG